MNDNVFSRLDEHSKQLSHMEKQQQEILELLHKADSTEKQTVRSAQPSDEAILKWFLKESAKEYLWFGTNRQFAHAKRDLRIVCILLFIVALVSTITTCLALRMGSPFTIVEIVWTILAIIIFRNCGRHTKNMIDADLQCLSSDRFQKDENDMWWDTNKEKGYVKWFRRLSYVAVIFNIVMIWVNSGGQIAVYATIFESWYLIASIFLRVAQVRFYSGYDTYVAFHGHNYSTNEPVTLVGDLLTKKLYSLAEFRRLFGKVMNV